MSKLLFRAATAAALMWAASASAQVIYKSTMPDGGVIYGAEPAPGAKRVETLKPPAGDAGVQPVGPEDASTLQQRGLQREQEAGRQDEIQEAERALRAAEAAQATGKEPLEGERQGTAGGASRLTDEYWERQKALEAAVVQARKRLEEVRGSAQ